MELPGNPASERVPGPFTLADWQRLAIAKLLTHPHILVSASKAERSSFDATPHRLPTAAVLECHLVSGAFGDLVKVRAREDMEAYHHLPGRPACYPYER